MLRPIRRLVAIIILLASLLPVQALAVESGWWWNPAESGRGFSIEIQGTSVFAATYLYTNDGRATWYSAQGRLSSANTFSAPLLAFSGGQTLLGPYVANTLSNPNAGTLTINFTDARHGTLTWPGGTIAIERFLSGARPPGFLPQSGWWWNPAESGRGFFVEMQGDVLVLAGYMYDSAGNPTWYLTSGQMTSPTLFQGQWAEYRNGQTLGGAYHPPDTPAKVGDVVLRFTSVGTAILTLPGGQETPLVRFRYADPLTKDSFTYSGVLPATGNVPYTLRNGKNLVAEHAYLGWIELFTDPQTPTATVAAAVQPLGGSIIAQTPRLGVYVIEVGVGNENTFLTALYSHAWVLQGHPVIAAVRGGNWALDWNSTPSGTSTPCADSHATIVTGIANRLGGQFELETVFDQAQQPQKLADFVLRKFEAVPGVENQVINMSINMPQPGSLGPKLFGYMSESCDRSCADTLVAEDQADFLELFLKNMQELYKQRPEIANRNLLVIVAGNTGVHLDDYLPGWKLAYPDALRRVVIVGGNDAANPPQIARQFMHLDDNSNGDLVYARAVDVNVAETSPEAGATTCSGTSYAAPHVAAILDFLWDLYPEKSSEQILAALHQALRNRGTSIIPQDGDGLTTFDFLLDVISLLDSPNPTYVLATTRAGNGLGTVGRSPLGPIYSPGTIVTVTASPAVGSAFAGWSGACSGSGACIVTMSADKVVTAKFDAVQTYALSVTKTGTGDGVVSSTPSGISCGDTCSASFAVGAAVALEAPPYFFSKFNGWSGACSGVASCVITMDAAKSVTANFIPRVFQGPFSGSGPFANTLDNCTFNVTLSGTISLAATEDDNLNVLGSAHVVGSWSNTVTSGNCFATSGPFDYTLPVSGKTSDIVFAGGDFPAVSFHGATSGSNLAGSATFTYTNTTGAIVTPVTLIRQP